MKTTFISILLCIFFSERACSQWKKIFDFSYPVITVTFKEYTDKPLDGFVSTDINLSSQRSKALWRTKDGGVSWHNVTFEDNSTGGYTTPYSFAFKSQSEGWFSSFLTGTYIYNTVDGGETWSRITVGAYAINALQYIPLTNRLIITGDSYVYSDNGTAFNYVDIPGSYPTIGIAFSDDRHGVISSGKVSPIISKFLYTSDGGLNWFQSNQQGEQFQPIGIEGTKTFYALSENDAYFANKAGTLSKSTDGGATWNDIYQHHDSRNFLGVTGTLQYNDKGIFYQTVEDGTEGIMMSDDSGETFFSICGPPNHSDTRFYVRDSLMYVGDKYGGLWVNTTGIGSNSTPIFSHDTLKLISTNCSSVSDILQFTLFDSCNGRQADLLETSISGGSGFSVLSGGESRKIVPNDSIRLTYQTKGVNDTSQVRLRFKLGWKVFDTSVTLVGTYKPAKTALLPTISDTSLWLKTTKCYGKAQTIYYSLLDSCIGTKGELLSATVLGSTDFQVNVNGDSILVTYNGAGYDTASLALKFRIYEYEYDTVITLYGIPSPSRDSLSFSARFVEEGVTAGGVTNLVIEPSKQVAEKGLTELELAVSYNGDILERVAETTAIPNANITVTAESVTGGITTTTLRITGTDLSLDPTQPAATIRFRTYLSDTTITPITLTTKLNPQDPSYERCTLSATTSDTTFALTLLCGDTSISGFLKYGKLQLSTIRPNPTSKDITVDFYTPTKGETGLQVIDELGRVIVEEKLEAKVGTNTRTISLPSTWSGTYYLRLQLGNDVVTGKFVKQ